MKAASKNGDVFFCRHGAERIGPLSRSDLRRYLCSGLIDARTLICVNDSGEMLPLGASAAANEITYVANRWCWQFSPLIYSFFLFFMPLFAGGIAMCGLYDMEYTLLGALLVANFTMSCWLFRLWKILLANKNKPQWRAVVYAWPMAIPFLNCVWIWIGYWQLLHYGRRFKSTHHLTDLGSGRIFYPVLILFYLMVIGWITIVSGYYNSLLFIRIVGVISWLWFGLTLLSLFFADYYIGHVIKNKLSNLAFGALRFCAQINYDILHRAVITLTVRMHKGFMISAAALLTISWLLGGWFWMQALAEYQLELQAAERNAVSAISAPNQSTLVNTSAVRHGK